MYLIKTAIWYRNARLRRQVEAHYSYWGSYVFHTLARDHEIYHRRHPSFDWEIGMVTASTSDDFAPSPQLLEVLDKTNLIHSMRLRRITRSGDEHRYGHRRLGVNCDLQFSFVSQSELMAFELIRP